MGLNRKFNDYFLHTDTVGHLSKPLDAIARDRVTWSVVRISISGLTVVSNDRVVDSDHTVWYSM